MQLFLASLLDTYRIQSLDELYNIVSIPESYTCSYSESELINESKKSYKVTLTLSDVFHQQISKTIKYTLN